MCVCVCACACVCVREREKREREREREDLFFFPTACFHIFDHLRRRYPSDGSDVSDLNLAESRYLAKAELTLQLFSDRDIHEMICH